MGNYENVMSALEKNGMTALFAKDRAEAKSIVESLLKEGDTVSHGGSVTLKECGIPELLSCGKYNYLDRSKAKDAAETEEIYAKTFSADVFLTSTNALTENGELYNVDGFSNRVAPMLFGPKKVIVVAGVNKIVPDVLAAAKRVKEIAAPLNCKRLNKETFCRENGKCVSIVNGDSDFCAGCESPDRICRSYVVMASQRDKERVTVVLVGEELGY